MVYKHLFGRLPASLDAESMKDKNGSFLIGPTVFDNVCACAFPPMGGKYLLDPSWILAYEKEASSPGKRNVLRFDGATLTLAEEGFQNDLSRQKELLQ